MLESIERILLDEPAIFKRLEALAAEITADYEGREVTALIVLHGALLFAADLLRRIPLPLKLASVRASSYAGGLASSGRVIFTGFTPSEMTGRHVLIVDDILDTGCTLSALRQELAQLDPPALSVRVCVLLQKEKCRRVEERADFVGFVIEDAFVVGYGLDFAESFRNLPFIGVLKTGEMQ